MLPIDHAIVSCCRTTDALSEFLEHPCYASGKIASVEAVVGAKFYKRFAPIPEAEAAA